MGQGSRKGRTRIGRARRRCGDRSKLLAGNSAIDTPPNVAIEEIAPYEIVVGEQLPVARDKLTPEQIGEIQEEKGVECNLNGQQGDNICVGAPQTVKIARVDDREIM